MAHDNKSLNTTPLKANYEAATKQAFLSLGVVKHIDITQNTGIGPMVDAMKDMAFSARDLGRAADIYDRML